MNISFEKVKKFYSQKVQTEWKYKSIFLGTWEAKSKIYTEENIAKTQDNFEGE